MRCSVLWVEDGARLELRNLCAPVMACGRYELDLADDVTTAVKFIKRKHYDVLIVDVRLPPGSDLFWRKKYQKAGSDRVRAELGLQFLIWLFKNGNEDYGSPPDGIRPEQVAVFTVDVRSDLERTLQELGIRVMEHKRAGLADDILIKIIERVRRQSM